MRLFNKNQLNYAMLAPYAGQYATVHLFDGKTYTGRIMEVRQDGILFHSDNPGFLFLPFLGIAALGLLSFGLGYGIGASRYPYPYSYPYGVY